MPFMGSSNGRERDNKDREEQKENPPTDARLTEEKGKATVLVSRSKHGGSSSNTTHDEISIREYFSYLLSETCFNGAQKTFEAAGMTLNFLLS